MEETNSVLQLCYHITKDQFADYGRRMGLRQFEAKKKRTTISGIAEILLAVALIVMRLTTSEQSNVSSLFYILGVVLIVLGAYNLWFYRASLPKLIEKSAVENYEKSQYLQNEIKIEFTNGELVETTVSREAYQWSEILRVEETPMLYAVIATNERTVLIPKEEIGDDRYLVEEFLKTVCNKFSKEYYTYR